MDELEQEIEKPQSRYGAGLILIATLASYALFCKGNYKAAFYFYPNAGGMGLNFYKIQNNGYLRRFFAIDYHAIGGGENSKLKLHYHRGETASQMKKHRPFQGGW